MVDSIILDVYNGDTVETDWTIIEIYLNFFLLLLQYQLGTYTISYYSSVVRSKSSHPILRERGVFFINDNVHIV